METFGTSFLQVIPGTRTSRIVPEISDRPWNNTLILQGSIAVSFSIVLLAAILMTVYPNSFSRVRLQCGCNQRTSLMVMKAVLVCTAFMVVGPMLMVLNKEILQSLNFNFPLTLSALGLSTTAVVIHILVASGICEVRPETHEAVAGKAWYSAVLPIALAKAMTLACGNAVYLHLGLGFIQMLKAFNPVIIVIVMWLCGLDLPSRFARWGVYMIISGTLVEVKGELHMTLIGVGLMMTSEIMEAINLVLTQKMLQNSKFTLLEGIYTITPPSAMFLVSAAAVLEWPRLSAEGAYRIMGEHPQYFVASCVLGLAVNFIGMAVVQATSSLTIKVLNTIRGIGVVFVGIIFYGEVCTNLELCGYTVALAGFTLYNCAQYIDSEKSSDVSEKDRK